MKGTTLATQEVVAGAIRLCPICSDGLNNSAAILGFHSNRIQHRHTKSTSVRPAELSNLDTRPRSVFNSLQHQ